MLPKGFSVFLSFFITGATLLIAVPGDVTVSIVDSSNTPVSPGQKDVSTPHPDVKARIVPDTGNPEYSDTVSVSTTYPGNTVNISLESSPDLATWTTVETVPATVNVSGGKQFFQVRVETVFNEFILVDTTGRTTSPTVDFYIGRYEVTLEEWNQTYEWALQNGYTFENAGTGCGLNHPVHSISFDDMVKWCNARSEREGLSQIYYTSNSFIDENVFRTGTLGPFAVVINLNNNGYRLPFEDEWTFAGKGGVEVQVFTYCGSDTVGDVAWYDGNSSPAVCGDTLGRGTWPVGEKLPNQIGAYDMSGNVFELCQIRTTSDIRAKGGAFNIDVFPISPLNPAYGLSPGYGAEKKSDTGLRLVRNIPPPAPSAQVETLSSSRKKPKKDQSAPLLR